MSNTSNDIMNFISLHKEKLGNRLLIGVPTRGLIRMEWALGRYGQTIPTNWSQTEILQWLSSFIPINYQLADAENMLAKAVVEGNYEWFLSLEDDNVIPPNTFVRLNEYMINGIEINGKLKKVPIVGGLYFTKSDPPEPILYRGRGNGYYSDWKFGDQVWVDGLPFGCTLIHGSIIKALWDESPEYEVRNTGVITRRVFNAPSSILQDEYGNEYKEGGTSDLEFCTRVIKDNILKKAGWDEYAKMKYPFLVDTNIFIRHIDQVGRQWPLAIPKKFMPEEKKKVEKDI